MAVCSVCFEESYFFYESEKYGILCEKCAHIKFKRRLIVCDECKKISLKHATVNKKIICAKCYSKTYERKKRTCIICNKIKFIILKEGVCDLCYKKQHVPQKRICSVCGENSIIHKSKGGDVCGKCYERPIKKCGICGEMGTITKIENNINICNNCYKCPEEICDVCKELKEVCSRNSGQVLCRACHSKQYIPPSKTCSICKKQKPIQKRFDNKLHCKTCWEKYRSEHDDFFHVKILIRSRIRDAFKRYSIGKCYKSSKYGINYKAIFDHIGKCPGNRKEYHIDHIFPLSAFNLNDPFEIWAAFHPTNHQWLLQEQNLSKSDNYNKEEIIEYMNNIRNFYQNC
jgi:hypothetical protein